MKVKWTNEKKQLHFNDLGVNQSFRIASNRSQGAVYTKVELDNILVNSTFAKYGMCEVATGKVFVGTNSPVELVEVEALINGTKPNIYA